MTGNAETQQQADSTVFIVDDDPSICEGICNLLEAVGIASRRYPSAESFWEARHEAKAGCLLLDARLPGISGVEFQEQLQKAGFGLPVIFMTAHGDIPMVRKVMKAGAIEFLIKPFQKEDLLHAIQQAFAFDRARRLEQEILNGIRARIESLSERERQVVELITTGLTNREVAEKLFLSVVTVKLYRRLAMEKMGVSTFADLMKMWEKHHS
jgi:FixJ family two-component response regulator